MFCSLQPLGCAFLREMMGQIDGIWLLGAKWFGHHILSSLVISMYGYVVIFGNPHLHELAFGSQEGLCG